MTPSRKNAGEYHWGGRTVRRGAGSRLKRAAANRAMLQLECDPAPVWLAALAAATHRATRDGQNRDVGWKCAFGRALYTNDGADAELIQPLGVSLEGGQTLAVSWAPGATSYTMQVYGES